MDSEQVPDGMSGVELMRIFLTSAGQTVARLAEILGGPEREGNDLDLPLVHRLSHNLKGAALQFGFVECGQVAQGMENLAASLLASGSIRWSGDREVLAEGVACLQNLLACLNAGTPAFDPGRICARLQARAQ